MRNRAALIVTALVTTPASAQVNGTVVDGATGQPIGGAQVRVQATNGGVTTSSVGAFALLSASGPEVKVAVGAKGYFVGSATVTTPAKDIVITLDAVPQDNDPTYAFRAPLDCGRCHFEQFADWTTSPMSKAGLNTWVYDVYDGSGTPGGGGGFVYTRDSVHAAANPESECASCHQPIAWLDAPFSALRDRANPDPSSGNGVSCDICHKIADIDETKPNYPGLYPGTVTVTRPVGPRHAPVLYGALGDVTFRAAKMRASYQPQLRAAVCGACHQDKNDPDGDGDFEEANGVISEPTYLEWLSSEYADERSPRYADCVDCHMPPTGMPQACDKGQPMLTRPPEQIRSHAIEGTTPQFLDNAVTATMSASLDGDTIRVSVAIINDRTGHHVPTGVTIRNMILLVEARRLQDGLTLVHTSSQTVHELGGVGDPAMGYYAGLPGKLFAKVNHDATGAGPTFFTDATGIRFDSRIPALATDRTSYRFDVPNNSGQIEIDVRLIYRRSWRALTDAKGWTEDGHGQPLEDVQAPHFGHLMLRMQQTLGTPLPPDAGVVDTGPAAVDAGPPDAGRPPADAGVGGSDPGDCGCTTSRRGGQQSVVWMVLLGLALLSRRR